MPSFDFDVVTGPSLQKRDARLAESPVSMPVNPKPRNERERQRGERTDGIAPAPATG